jgi:hypothetical protein
MKTIQYLVRISRDPRSDWGASVPDLLGCVATGKTLDSALAPHRAGDGATRPWLARRRASRSPTQPADRHAAPARSGD